MPPVSPPGPTQPRLLLVEDEPLLRLLARQSLETLPSLVLEADSCHAARNLLAAGAFDLIIMDYRLPDGTGLDLLRWLRDRQRMDPVLLLSAEADALLSAVRKELGILDVLEKPVEMEALRAVVARWHAQVAQVAQAAPEHLAGDRFRWSAAPEILTAAFVNAMAVTGPADAWPALGLEQTQSVDADALAALRDLAAGCRRHGGRLALVGAPPAVTAGLRGQGLDKDVELLPHRGALAALARRPASFSERSALIASTVTTTPPPATPEPAA